VTAGSGTEARRPLTPEELEARLRQVGETRYHHLHPFHHLLHQGRLNRGQVQAWALNRYYYQRSIPIKDAVILSRMTDPELRRAWRQRIIDHDGEGDRPGGIEKWLALAEGVGLDRGEVAACHGILPATRFAVDAYIQLVRERPLLEAIASSLTELFAPGIISVRVRGMLAAYDFISPQTLAYFDSRLDQAPRDADFALAHVRDHARTLAQQEAVIAALETKCDILWSQLDALYFAYVAPRLPPPGAFIPRDFERGDFERGDFERGDPGARRP